MFDIKFTIVFLTIVSLNFTFIDSVFMSCSVTMTISEIGNPQKFSKK